MMQFLAYNKQSKIFLNKWHFKKYNTYIEPTTHQAPTQCDLQILTHLIIIRKILFAKEIKAWKG